MKVQHQFFISRLSFYLFGFLFFGLSSQTTSVLAQTIPDAIANNSLAQVINVRELQDVYPSDWAYEALRSLTERYGCISGFPNGTYKGSKPLTRYEFAAGLNSCLNQIERFVTNSDIPAEDLATIQRLSQDFAAELAT